MFENYPFPTPRPHARETIEKVEKAIADKKRFILIGAPTGSGKSSTAVAVARTLKSVILTPTRILQDQYANTPQFDKEYTIKGKSNYNCGLHPHMKVDEAVCCSDIVADNNRSIIPFPLPESVGNLAKALKSQCAAREACPYYTKIYNIGKVPGAVPNFDLFFRIKQYQGSNWGTDMGKCLVIDEAHQLISKAKDVFGFTCSNMQVSKLFGPAAVRHKDETVLDWLTRLKKLASDELKEETDGKKVSKIDAFHKRVDYVLAQDLSNVKKFYIEDLEDEIEIKPLDMRYLKDKIFFPFETVIMLSATFPDNFTELLGITSDECIRIDVPSFFSVTNRPIVSFVDLPVVNKETVLNEVDPTIECLDKILNHHKDHKGIIHTGNYKFLMQLKGIYGSNRRMIWVNQEDAKDERFKYHTESPHPTVLVTPSFMEGVDLKDDLARFGILLKMPYPALDEYAKRMMKIFPSWYNSTTALSICQAYGRQVRNENDWARFYILDGMFGKMYLRAKRSFSEYFREALVSADTKTFFSSPME